MDLLKKRSFVTNCLIYLKIWFEHNNLWKADLMYNYPNIHVHTFRIYLSVIWECVWIKKILHLPNNS